MGIINSFFFSYQNNENPEVDQEQINIEKLNDLEEEFKKKYTRTQQKGKKREGVSDSI